MEMLKVCERLSMSVRLDGELCEKEDCFVYLGSQACSDGGREMVMVQEMGTMYSIRLGEH